MKQTYITLSLVALFMMCGIHSLMAQQGNVEIVTTYRPEVASATKLLAPTRIADDPKIEPEVEYNVKTSLWQIDLNTHQFRPARASYWDYSGYKQFFVKADVGYPLASDLCFRYAMQTPKLGYFGVGVDHAGDFATRNGRSIAEIFNMQNRVLLNGGIFAGSRMFEASLAYDNDIYNGYAMLDPERRLFHDAELRMRFGDDFINLDKLNFAIEVDGGMWAHRLPQFENPQGEYRAGASVKLARMFSDNLINVDLDFGMWQSSKQLSYGDIRFGGSVGYSRRFGFVSVEAGIGYLYDKVKMRDKASHFVLPRAKVMFDLEKASFVPYVELSSGVSHNDIASLYSLNPYVDYASMATSLSTMPNTLNYNLSLGFTGTVFESRLTYHAYVGADFIRDQLFWYISRQGEFGVDTSNNNRIFMGVGAKYLPIAGLELGLDFSCHFDNHKSQYAQSEPQMRGSVGVRYTLRDWSFYVDGKLLGAREWSYVDRELPNFTMPTTFDLGAGVSYCINNRLEVFVKGQNLINSKIYDFAHYTQPGIGFKVGVKVDF